MNTKTTKVTLLSWTQNPIQTIYVEWEQSRTDGPVPLPEDVNAHDPKVREIFEKVVDMKIPLAETLDFVFMIEHASVALREQLVRHRIGHRHGSSLGMDLIPDLDGSTFWAQTMRVKNMGAFADQGEYLLPESIKGNDKQMPGRHKTPNRPIGASEKTVEEYYHEQMQWIQTAYNKLIAAGVPVEDARNILPLGCQHRLTWKVNLSALMHVLSKRGCWIAQLGMWEPVVKGVVEELATKVDPYFRRLIDPPCFERGTFKGCCFKLENENRVKGDDPYPPCSLFAHHHAHEMPDTPLTNLHRSWTRSPEGKGLDAPNGHAEAAYMAMASAYGRLWGRDPSTGEPSNGTVHLPQLQPEGART